VHPAAGHVQITEHEDIHTTTSKENDDDSKDKARKSQHATKTMHSTKGSKKVHKGGSDTASLDHGMEQSGRNGRQI
jgi:hypothetical protein